jgi:hypothetical protein
MKSIRLSQETPVTGGYDVLVCGGGPAGCAAALAAAGSGLSVLLVESQGQLGGMGTSGLVAHWLGGRTFEGRWVVGGIFRDLSEKAAALGIALLPQPKPGAKFQPHGWYNGLLHGVPFDPFAMAAFLDDRMAEAGVHVLFNTQAVEPIIKDGVITHVVTASKNGLQAVAVRTVIDATGDADLAARSGCIVRLGRDGDGLMTPATLMFHVDNVDQDALAAYINEKDQPRFKTLIEELRAAGEWPFPYEIFISVQLSEPGTMMINTPRLCGVDGTDAVSLSDGYRRGRAEIRQLMDVMRRRFPGFQHARLKAVAPLMGVRETRRIEGDYVLSVADLTSGKAFEDTIGFSSYGWDLPDPKKPSLQPMHGMKKSPFTPIPYRIMVPRPVTNLICPGRAVSVERDVLGPLRVMAPVMAMGEAAGCAAVQVAAKGIPFSQVEVTALRSTLRARGAIVDPEALHG